MEGEYLKDKVASSIQHLKRALDAEEDYTVFVSASDRSGVGIGESGTETLDMCLEGLFSAYTTSVSEDVSESESDKSECMSEVFVPEECREESCC